MQENYLAKWLNNELSEAELAEFKKSAEYPYYKRIIDTCDTFEVPEFNVDKALSEFKHAQKNDTTKVIPLWPFKKVMRVAAAIAILVAGSYFYINSLNETFVTDYAENTTVTLPDASEIILNADSEISYSEKDWDEKRNISLKGEAFFKVAKGKTFTVSTKNGTVTVLGTQFNVENRKGFFEVTCYEGLVSVTFQGKETKLPAGTTFLVINNEIQSANTPDTAQPSWLNNESSFTSIPLKYVLAEFQRQHNITVETKNVDTQQLYTGSFSNTDKNIALRSISVPSQIKFKLEGNKVLFYAENAP
ncbi:FecR family protein [Costertonia aggregata]|uniref:FecR domain-containing protein n=1 Tax=Costertonia aggregata TaxID=343403 RepID=A0A7H9ASF5_9FLAO|nr:FecR domain-containing protein [Costertonia aggregata]QLG46125.1 FecR domain-containing protein [Costertonia aggregata]